MTSYFDYYQLGHTIDEGRKIWLRLCKTAPHMFLYGQIANDEPSHLMKFLYDKPISG